MKLLAVIAAALALTGCAIYRTSQECVFVDEDGRLMTVLYEVSNTDHVTTFVSPGNGKEMEFRSKLRVLLGTPDDGWITAYQGMNFVTEGTLYKTDDNEWHFFANGFTCELYRRIGSSHDYERKFQGTICRTEKKAK